MLGELNVIFTDIPYSIKRIIFIIILWFLLKKIVNYILGKHMREKTIGKIYTKNVLNAFITVVAVFCILSTFEVTSKILSLLLASSGLIAIVVGIAAQESLGNIISGFTIILFKPFEVNDHIILKNNNVTGKVKSITLRHTIIQTFTNSYVTVPNSIINKDIIENYNLKESRTRNFLDITIAYESDIDKALDIIKRCVVANSHAIHSENTEDVKIQVRDFDTNGISLRVSVWTETIDDNFTACSDLRIAILKAFKENNIEIPYPHMQIL